MISQNNENTSAKSNESSVKSKENSKTSKPSQNESNNTEKEEIQELFNNLDDELVEGRLKLPDSSNQSRSSSVTSNISSLKSQKNETLSSHKSQRTIKSKTSERSEMSEEQEKREVQELLNNLSEEMVEGTLKDPSRFHTNSSEKEISQNDEKKSVKSKTNKSILTQGTSKNGHITDNSDEQEKKELKEFLDNLKDELEVGILRDPNGLHPQDLSSSENTINGKEVTKSSKASSKISLESLKARQPSENSEEQEKKDLKELLDNLQDELEVGILRLPDGRHNYSSTASIRESDKVQTEKEGSKKTVSYISHASSKASQNTSDSEKRELQEVLDNLSEELEIGILQEPK